jgi:hypothetical protein
MSNNEPDDESADSQQESEQQPADSEQPSAQSDEQPAEQTEQSTGQSEEQPADSEQPADQAEGQPADSDQAAEESEEQPTDSDQPAEQSAEQPADDTNKWAEQFDDTGGAPQKHAKKGDCSSWEKGSPMLFAKRLADHYIRNELGTEPARLKSVWGFGSPSGTPMDNGGIVYTDGREIMVTLNYPDHVIARGSKPPPLGPRCIYEYDCTPSGELVFKKRSCDDGR